jgi:hypothetical protein
MPRTFTLPCTITKTAIKHIPHKPLKGCPDNEYYDITKDRETFRIVLKSNGKVMFTTVNKTIAVATLEGMLA